MTSAPAPPRVSVIMAVYNGSRYLREAIDSVCSQDLRDLEFVIVDDCSTDNTAAIVASYGEPRVVYVRNERNEGQTRSLNRALAMARGRYVARIDADDVYLPGKLSRQVAFMEAHPDVAVCGTSAVKIDADGHDFGLFVPPVRLEDIRFSIHHRVPVAHVTVMMRRDIVSAAGGYDERYRYAADYALWSTLVKKGHQIANLPDPLMKFREFRDSLGAVHKLGVAGEESAGIIESNAWELAHITLSTGEARDVALLFFPAAGLTPVAICRAYRNLRRLASVAYNRVPWRVRLQLRAVLFWSLLKRAAHSEPVLGAGSGRRELAATVRRSFGRPGIALTAAAAWLLSFAGEQRIVRMKESALPRLLKTLR